MGKYFVDISGKFKIDQMTQALQEEEAFFAEFKESYVRTDDEHAVVNHAKFEECDPRPAKLVIVIKEGDPAPAGTAKFWSGTMVIADTIVPVEAYR